MAILRKMLVLGAALGLAMSVNAATTDTSDASAAPAAPAATTPAATTTTTTTTKAPVVKKAKKAHTHKHVHKVADGSTTGPAKSE